MLKREILVPTGPQSWTAFTSVLTSLLISLLAVGFSEALVAQTGSLNISTPEQIAADAKSVPCSSKDRLDAVVRLFDRMGAAAGTVSIEKFKGGIENVVVRKPSNGKELVVVGAHYDKTPAGCGAVDNWSGIVTIGHVYRAVRDTPLQKTVVFVAFGKEEEGLRGSEPW